MNKQFEKLREIALEATRLQWSAGGRYLGPINPFGIASQDPAPAFRNWFILAQNVPTVHLHEGFEDFPPGTQAVVLVGLDDQFEFAQWNTETKTLGAIFADTTRDGTMRSLVNPPKASRFTWTVLYPPLEFKELRLLPPRLEDLCRIVEFGNIGHRNRKLEALDEISESGKEFLPELHARLNPLVGLGEDMGTEYCIATTLAELGDADENIVREISFHLSLASADGGGIWNPEHVERVKCIGIRALSHVRQPDTVILLRRHLEDENINIRKAAIWALGALGEEDARTCLESLIDCDSEQMRRAVEASLSLFGSDYFEIRSRSDLLDKLVDAQLYLYKGGKQHGPFPAEDIRTWLNCGQVDKSDQVWYEGAPGWMPLSSVFKSIW